MKLTILLLLLPFLALAQPKPQPVRATWITNVGSDALSSPEKVKATVAECKRHGLNTLYVVTWNKGLTMYPSPVVERYIGIRQDPVYKGFDPIAAIIAEGHKKGMKVIGWFEYGFAYDYQDTNSIWLKKYPHWAGRDAAGNLLQKNKFFWWNSLHPEVQSFMTELILDFVKRYDADGIQGDDRLPAMPSNGGYDAYTKGLYASEHNGNQPPANYADTAWVSWRTNKLSSYLTDLYKAVKKEKPSYRVSMAPSIHPWAKEQYLQNGPEWLQRGICDELLPQLYRYNIEGYEKIVAELAAQIPANQRHKVYPGILTSLGDGYRIKPALLMQMIALNRKYGFTGESTFYYEGLKGMASMYRGNSKVKSQKQKAGRSDR